MLISALSFGAGIRQLSRLTGVSFGVIQKLQIIRRTDPMIHLNSKYTSYYLMNKFRDKHLAGGYLAINKSTIEQLPFKIAEDESQTIIINNVKTILKAKSANPSADTTALESEIDRLVYQLYGLTDEEIAIIEKK